jgi:betaine-homocysteine S-methyltransferase
MSRPSPRSLERRLADGVVIGAEGYVFELERRGYIKAGPYVPEVILDEPDALRPTTPIGTSSATSAVTATSRR